MLFESSKHPYLLDKIILDPARGPVLPLQKWPQGHVFSFPRGLPCFVQNNALSVHFFRGKGGHF